MELAAIHIAPSDQATWKRLLLTAVNGSYRQTMGFEYARAAEGWEAATFVFYDGPALVAGAHYALKRSPFCLGRVADLSAGFLLASEAEPALYEYLLSHFLSWARDHEASFVRVTTWLPKSVASVRSPYSTWVPRLMAELGFQVFRPGRHTYWIDLTQDEDTLLSRMKKQTRYNVRKAVRSGASVEIHERVSPELFDSFYSVYSERARQKRLSDRREYDRVKGELVPIMDSGLGILCFAKTGDWVCNAIFASNFGEAASIHSGMDPRAEGTAIPFSPGHLSRWHLIRYLKERHVRIHDMGFCPGPAPLSGHPRYGIWSFKYGFGGDHVEFLPTYARPLGHGTGSLIGVCMRVRARLWGM